MAKKTRKKATRKKKEKPDEEPAFGITERPIKAGTAIVETTEPAEEPTGTGHAVDYSPADWVPIQCPECGSPNRKPFKGRTRIVRTGVRTHQKFHHEYDRVVFRPTECLDCGRKIMTREYRMGGDDSDE